MLKRKQKKTTKKLNEAIQKNEVHVTVNFVFLFILKNYQRSIVGSSRTVNPIRHLL